MKPRKCAFHTNQNLVNFCRSTQCLLPMCPSCVKIHSAEHLKLNSHGNYDCISDMYLEVNSTLQNTVKALIIYGNELKEILNDRQTQKISFLKTLKDMRTKITNLINKFIDGLQQQVINECNQLQNYQLQEFSQIDNQIQKISCQARTQIQNLNGQKSIKAIINHLSSNMPSYYGYQINQISSKINQFKQYQIFAQKQPKISQLNQFLKVIAIIYQKNFMQTIKLSSQKKVKLKDSNISKNCSTKDYSINASYKKLLC